MRQDQTMELQLAHMKAIEASMNAMQGTSTMKLQGPKAMKDTNAMLQDQTMELQLARVKAIQASMKARRPMLKTMTSMGLQGTRATIMPHVQCTMLQGVSIRGMQSTLQGTKATLAMQPDAKATMSIMQIIRMSALVLRTMAMLQDMMMQLQDRTASQASLRYIAHV